MGDSNNIKPMPGYWYFDPWKDQNPLGLDVSSNTTTGNSITQDREIDPPFLADLSGDGEPDTILSLPPGHKPEEGLDFFIPRARGDEAKSFLGKNSAWVRDVKEHYQFRPVPQEEFTAWNQPKLSALSESALLSFGQGVTHDLPSKVLIGAGLAVALPILSPLLAAAIPEIALFMLGMSAVLFISKIAVPYFSDEISANDAAYASGDLLSGIVGPLVGGAAAGRGLGLAKTSVTKIEVPEVNQGSHLKVVGGIGFGQKNSPTMLGSGSSAPSTSSGVGGKIAQIPNSAAETGLRIVARADSENVVSLFGP